jgi:hypothetical protein
LIRARNADVEAKRNKLRESVSLEKRVERWLNALCAHKGRICTSEKPDMQLTSYILTLNGFENVKRVVNDRRWAEARQKGRSITIVRNRLLWEPVGDAINTSPSTRT